MRGNPDFLLWRPLAASALLLAKRVSENVNMKKGHKPPSVHKEAEERADHDGTVSVSKPAVLFYKYRFYQ
jgi:hypothetical protein